MAVWQGAEQLVPLLAVFETGPQGWIGVTAHDRSTITNLEQSAQRGVLVYERK